MITLDECARICNEELRFECLTFDFCYISGECRLSLNFTTSNDIMADGQCDVYESNKNKKFISIEFRFVT